MCVTLADVTTIHDHFLFHPNANVNLNLVTPPHGVRLSHSTHMFAFKPVTGGLKMNWKMHKCNSHILYNTNTDFFEEGKLKQQD